MRITDLIAAARDGKGVSREELRLFTSRVAAGEIPDYQVAAWLMAAYIKGLSRDGTLALTLAMRDSGTVIEWDEGPPLADKHSTGGVGDKISLILAPLAACCGLRVPMISGRSLGHTGGTLDKLGSIPGMDVSLPLFRFIELVTENGVAMSGQTDDLAPADRKLYALRDSTSTVTSIPLICASILSKKLAENTDVLVFDVKTGKGAFMEDETAAGELADQLTGIAREAGVKAAAMITSMDHPLGMKVGNALEVQESLDVLRGSGPEDVRYLSVSLAARMLRLAMPDSYDEAGAERYCLQRLEDGSAFRKFVVMVESQGGDLGAFETLPPAPVIMEVRASRSGLWSGMNAYVVGEAVRELGGGRYCVEQGIRPDVGWEQLTAVGADVSAGDILGLVHAASEDDALTASRRIESSSCWDEPGQPLVRGAV
ncbi:MAG: thymidine phosphorylase [Candidatus Fermentibacteraceae bacterium]|nr:thymidine phosphorylase [Candidatus Fermentibacteraceae bacterium]